MAKKKINCPPVSEIPKQLKKGNILPFYYLFGEDLFSLTQTAELIIKASEKFITSDFDKELIYGNDRTAAEITTLASSFPFGSEKKIVYVKEAEKLKERKSLSSYANSPAEFTVLILVHNGSITGAETEPIKSILKNNFLFEAAELKGKYLISWLINNCESNGKTISPVNAEYFVELIGEDKFLLENQLEKIFTFMGDKDEITFEIIRTIASSVKVYSIFDLQEAIGKKDKETSLKIAFNLLQNGIEVPQIVGMLTKYFTTLSKLGSLMNSGLQRNEIASRAGIYPYFFDNYIRAKNQFTVDDLYNSVNALYKADLSSKTTSKDKKTIVTELIAEILN
ncbi:MAG: DNA polymerase III subunit delta [Ignavibacteriales bacterium]|nr:MAG: DNA polymerase III subunit delta [Ignavibacteriales bacterium]